MTNLKQSLLQRAPVERGSSRTTRCLCFADEASGNVFHKELEKPIDYTAGVFHPVHIGDQLDSGRYLVIHKLGHGGYGIVWLCVDQVAHPPTHVAIKIMREKNPEPHDGDELVNIALNRADEAFYGASRYFCLAQREFTAQSSNAFHKCLVYPVLGPAVCMARNIFRDKPEVIWNIAKEVAEALTALHGLGIQHGGQFDECNAEYVEELIFARLSILKYFTTLEIS